MKSPKTAKAAMTGDMSAAVSSDERIIPFEPTHYNAFPSHGKFVERVQMFRDGSLSSIVTRSNGEKITVANQFLLPILNDAHTLKPVQIAERTTAAENSDSFKPTHHVLTRDGKPGDKVQVLEVEEFAGSRSLFSVRHASGSVAKVWNSILVPIQKDEREENKPQEAEKSVSKLGKMSNDRIHLTFKMAYAVSVAEWGNIKALAKDAFDVDLSERKTTLIVRPSQFGRFVAKLSERNIPYHLLDILEPTLEAENRDLVIDASRNANTMKIKGDAA